MIFAQWKKLILMSFGTSKRRPRSTSKSEWKKFDKSIQMLNQEFWKKVRGGKDNYQLSE